MPSQLIWLGIVLIIISLIAYVLGAKGVAGMSAGLGRMVLIVGIVLGLIFVVISMLNRGGFRPAIIHQIYPAAE